MHTLKEKRPVKNEAGKKTAIQRESFLSEKDTVIKRTGNKTVLSVEQDRPSIAIGLKKRKS